MVALFVIGQVVSFGCSIYCGVKVCQWVLR